MTTTDPPSWSAHFAQELKIARQRAGFTSQRALGEAAGWSRSRIADVESGQVMPPFAMVEALESLLGCDGLLTRIWTIGRRGDLSRWIAEYFEAEEQASHIREFQPSLPPGLLQTREAAAAILGSGRYGPGTNGQSVDEKVEIRLHRQRILTEGVLESYWVILDEAVLHRIVGDPRVMKGQLRHILDTINTGSVSIQVLPFTAGAYMVVGPMMILDTDDKDRLVHLDGPVAGTTTSETNTVRECVALFDVLRSQAASLTDSADLIQARMEEL